jgi:cobalamin synthase
MSDDATTATADPGTRVPDPELGAGPLAVAVMTVRLLLEVTTLLALALGGFTAAPGPASGVLLGLAAPLAAAAVWARYGSPAAPNRLAQPRRLLLELALLAAGAVGFVLAGRPALAIVFAVVAAVDTALVYLLAWLRE